ncbi:MAG: hypothetical protein HY677_06615 [Chloroflexi bacterium]|nr:hypothetical protein [Chloroflexota bacterium]
MPGGYMGRILFVDLSRGSIEEESPPESLYRDYIGGYGIAAKVAVERQKPGIDALGPENILGFVAGPLTASPAPYGSRYYVTAKSPLTGTWGDANGGGQFGPQMKFAGVDAIFVSGMSPRPVYLLVRDGKGEIRDAGHLWGKDSVETEQALKAEWGKEAGVACIGPAGEKLSFISGIVNEGGRLAARAGVGAVAGSKRLKAIVVLGNNEVPIADKERATLLRREYLQTLKGPAVERRRKYVTCAAPVSMAAISQTPA